MSEVIWANVLPLISPSFNMPSGDNPVNESVEVTTAAMLSSAPDRKTRSNKRLIRIALNGRGTCLPIETRVKSMATNDPGKTSHTGKPAGRLKASNMPVMMAGPVWIAVGLLKKPKVYLCRRYAKKRHESTEAAIILKLPNPKKINRHNHCGQQSCEHNSVDVRRSSVLLNMRSGKEVVSWIHAYIICFFIGRMESQIFIFGL